MKILAIDPGLISGVVFIEGERNLDLPVIKNKPTIVFLKQASRFEILNLFDNFESYFPRKSPIVLIETLEFIADYVGQSTFQTAFLIGQLIEKSIQNKINLNLVFRSNIKYFHIETRKGKDQQLIKRIVDKYISEEFQCQFNKNNYGKGTKKTPGYFYGMSGHCWQAFALASYYYETGGKIQTENNYFETLKGKNGK